jgi:hypothetical protein
MEVVDTMQRLEKELECTAESEAASCSVEDEYTSMSDEPKSGRRFTCRDID